MSAWSLQNSYIAQLTHHNKRIEDKGLFPSRRSIFRHYSRQYFEQEKKFDGLVSFMGC